MNAHTVWWLTLLALIKDCSCALKVNPFVLESPTLTATEGSCIEIKCKNIDDTSCHDNNWFWIKDPKWSDVLKNFNGTIVYSKHTQRPVSPLFEGRVHYIVDSSKSGPEKLCNILICDLKTTDSGNYSFRYDNEPDKWITDPGTNLTVVENKCLITFEKPPVVVENQVVNLTCSTLSSCTSNLTIDSLMQQPSTGLSEHFNALNSEDMTPRNITYSFKTNWMQNGIEFSCQTSDNKDKYLVRNVSLTVEYAPRDVRAKISSEQVKENDPVNLTCSAKGNPNVNFSWFQNNKMLEFSVPEITFTSAEVSHDGLYYCEAKNEHGTDKSNILNITVLYAPEVYVQKLPETIKEGDKISLTCNVNRSQPSPSSFYWLKDGVEFEQKQTYVFTSIQPTDSGNYSCTATNTVGPGTSKSSSLRVQYKPRSSRVSIHGNIVNNEVRVNSHITFTCDSSAYPAPWYSWFSYKQSNPSERTFISNEKNFSLKPVQRADEACYTCNASNSIGEGASSEPTCIRVRFPPTNLTLSMETKVREGDSITITCSAESFPASTFLLKRSNIQSPEWQVSSKSQQSDNIFQHSFPATPAHAGSYICIASNGENTTKSKEMTLVVEYAPKEVTVSPSPELVVKENSSFSLACSAHSNPPVKLFTWNKDRNNQLNKNTQNYSVVSASPSDSGLYNCIAENEVGPGNSQTIEVKVMYAPKKTTIIKGEEVQLHDGKRSVKLSCSSNGYPDAKYYWYSKTKVPVFEGQTFTVHSDKAGAYYCVAVNDMGQKSSDLIEPFNDIVRTIVLSVLLICLFLFIVIIIIRSCRYNIRSVQQRAANTWPCGGFLAGWTRDRRRTTESEMGLVGPFRSRDDLLTDQPCRPNAQQHQPRPDVTSASNINTVYCTVKPSHIQQAPSAQKPARQQAGHEDDSLNYASLHFQKKEREPEDAIYSKVSKPMSKPTKEKEEGEQRDYENVSAVLAVKHFNLYESDSDTSDEEEDVGYTQVNIRQQRAKSSSSSSTSSEDSTEYSHVKI